MLKNKIGLVIISIFLVGFSMLAHAESDPVNLLQSIADSMIASLKQNQATLKTKPEIVYKLAYKYVVPHADLDEMSKRVLPPQTWNQATSAQREEFKKQFTLTLIRTYASALTAYREQTVKFYPIRGAIGKTVQVSSDISGAGQPIHVNYQLIRVSSDWRLLDMNVEGVGMLDSFRAQFADILSQNTMQQLLNRLAAHNARIK